MRIADDYRGSGLGVIYHIHILGKMPFVIHLLLQLMVHVGVSGMACELTLEQQAHNDGYDRFDVDGQVPEKKTCVDGSCHNVIASDLKMPLVCEDVNNVRDMKVKAVVSHDPGR